MTFYIGNATRQELELTCAIPEQTRIFRRVISSGKQLEIKGLTQAQEQAIIDHMVRYGAVKREDLHGKLNRFMGWIYSGKPLNMDEFHYGFEEVLETAENRSVTEATRSAIASHKAVQGMSESTEVEMEEEHPKDKKKRRKMKLSIDPKADQTDKVPLQ